MFPWGHAAVAYLLLSGQRRRRGARLTAGATAAVLVGSQLPDLVDKPLAHYAGLLPTGRSLAHSLVTGSLLLGLLVGLLVVAGAARVALPFGVGYLSHVLADAPGTIIGGNLHHLGYLAWPVTPVVDEPGGADGIVEIFARADVLAPMFLLQLILVVIALAAWHADGDPGLAPVRNWIARRLGRPANAG